jgi:hypothetical protein
MELVHIPQHRNPLEEEADQELVNITRDPNAVSGQRAATHEELRERLHLKMAEIRGRNVATNEARAKRKLKRLGDGGKQQQKEELKQKLIQVGKQAGGGAVSLKKLKSEIRTGGASIVQRPKVKTETGKVVFSKFDFTADEVAPELESAGHKKKNVDPKAALAKIAKQKEMLQMWEEKGRDQKVKRIEDNIAWQAALQKAEGVKVKDDVELLKKSLKKQQQKKKASKSKWENRNSEVEKKKEGQQAKRKENIMKRKTDKKKGKVKMMQKKGRHVPGAS